MTIPATTLILLGASIDTIPGEANFDVDIYSDIHGVKIIGNNLAVSGRVQSPSLLPVPLNR
jgi:hypothetical protein